MSFLKTLKPYLPAGLWLIIIVLLSSYPGSKIPQLPVMQIDKFVHALMYGILAIGISIPYHTQFLTQKKRWTISLKIIFFGIFFGGLMEILQTNIFINRSGNWYDFLANAFGIILGALCFPFLIKRVPIIRWMKIS
jgi:VanZ family protein